MWGSDPNSKIAITIIPCKNDYPFEYNRIDQYVTPTSSGTYTHLFGAVGTFCITSGNVYKEDQSMKKEFRLTIKVQPIVDKLMELTVSVKGNIN